MLIMRLKEDFIQSIIPNSRCGGLVALVREGKKKKKDHSRYTTLNNPV
jgi:vacuole morphology and inheritance protein 14